MDSDFYGAISDCKAWRELGSVRHVVVADIPSENGFGSRRMYAECRMESSKLTEAEINY